MYQYSDFDQNVVNERVDQFREQTQRYLRGDLSEEEFRPLRLMNGLYIQAHAPMLRIAIPYGLLSARQVRGLADIADKYDRGFGHFTTRQNIQLNWPKLEEVPDLLGALSEIQMHAVQTSGNCIRNVTTDELAGVAADEATDPRVWCELIRQWSTFHPEFSFLPRKFKIAVTGARRDRAATLVHDIGIHLVRSSTGNTVANVFVGGGLGRTPHIGSCIRENLDRNEILRYLEAIMRVYNLYGRRDNKFKARIKILVKALGPEEFKRLVDLEYENVIQHTRSLTESDWEGIQIHFAAPQYEVGSDISEDELLMAAQRDSATEEELAGFRRWYDINTRVHKVAGYRIAYLSLKPLGGVPGDAQSWQLHDVADLSEDFGYGEIRTTHTQNLVLPDVRQDRLFELYRRLVPLQMARANINRFSDIICCPGLDYCGLANAGTIGVTQEMDAEIESLDFEHDLGDLRIKISGCMNACGHHHVGHIGILGVEKHGEEWYQIQVGGSAEEDATLAKVLGPAVAKDELATFIKRLVEHYISVRDGVDESFLDCVRRLGSKSFKEALYDA